MFNTGKVKSLDNEIECFHKQNNCLWGAPAKMVPVMR